MFANLCTINLSLVQLDAVFNTVVVSYDGPQLHSNFGRENEEVRGKIVDLP